MKISTDQFESNPRSTKQQLNIEGQKIYASTTKFHFGNIPEWYMIFFRKSFAGSCTRLVNEIKKNENTFTKFIEIKRKMIRVET